MKRFNANEARRMTRMAVQGVESTLDRIFDTIEKNTLLGYYSISFYFDDDVSSSMMETADAILSTIYGYETTVDIPKRKMIVNWSV